MKFSEAIDIYVHWRHTQGSAYVNGEDVLRSLCRQTGDTPLNLLSGDSVARYLQGSRCSPQTRRGRYSMVRRFLEYWWVRGEAPFVELPVPPKVNPCFYPYVYSPLQVAAILNAIESTQHRSRVASARVLRMFLITLYATGGAFNEVLRLRSSHIDCEQSQMTLSGDRRVRRRQIPISPDLSRELKNFKGEFIRSGDSDIGLFVSLSGKPLTSQYLIDRFSRLLCSTQVVREDGLSRKPRMQDFRATFAVQRLTKWLTDGSDLRRLLPALSAYMGYASLCGADKYLRLVPEKLAPDIEKLSEPGLESLWRDDASIMDFLKKR